MECWCLKSPPQGSSWCLHEWAFTYGGHVRILLMSCGAKNNCMCNRMPLTKQDPRYLYSVNTTNRGEGDSFFCQCLTLGSERGYFWKDLEGSSVDLLVLNVVCECSLCRAMECWCLKSPPQGSSWCLHEWAFTYCMGKEGREHDLQGLPVCTSPL
jgi:hypothetical protein